MTAELLALKPYVLPKPKQKPPRNESATLTRGASQISVTRLEGLSSRPCETCRGSPPDYYCDACKDWHEARQRERRELDNKKRERENRLQRERRAWRRHLRPSGRCAVCGTAFKGKRKDAQHCSAACRTRAFRGRHNTPLREVTPHE